MPTFNPDTYKDDHASDKPREKSERDPVPEGSYVVQFGEAKRGTSKSGWEHMLLRYEITEGYMARRWLFDRIGLDIAKFGWKWHSLCFATSRNSAFDTDSQRQINDTFRGAKFLVDVVHKQGETRVFVDVKNMRPIEATVDKQWEQNAPAPAPVQTTTDAGTFDDDSIPF